MLVIRNSRDRSSRHSSTSLHEYLELAAGRGSASFTRVRLFAEAATWLERAIGRTPSLADLTARNLAATERCVFEHGYGQRRASQLRRALRTIANDAHRRAQLAPVEPGRAAVGRVTQFDKADWTKSPAGPQTLSAALETLVQTVTPKTLSKYRRVVRAFNQFQGRYATVADVVSSRLEEFAEDLCSKGRSKATIDDYKAALGRVARALEPDRFAPRRSKLDALPVPDPGSLREFYVDVFKPQRMLGRTWQHHRDCNHTLRLLREFHGGDLPLCELGDRVAAGFFEWLLARGQRPVTVNTHRARLFAIWRLAHQNGLVTAEPRVRKLPESVDVPDAWNEDELRRIIAAPLSMTWRRPVAGIDAGRYWHALLLVAYWTAMRTGTIRQLAWEDVDLDASSIRVPGRKMKNRRGQRFKIGTDAVAALQAIRLPDRELVFPWPHEAKWFCTRVTQIIAAAGVPRSSRARLTGMHKMRRSVATITAMRRGVGAASELLGHSTSEVTRRYVDPTKLPGHDATQYLPVLTIDALAVERPTTNATQIDGGAATSPAEMLRVAQNLSRAGNLLAAAAMCRVTLERWLRAECEVHQCQVEKTAGILARAGALKGAGRLRQSHLATIRKLTKPANKAVHGYSVAAPKVQAMLSMLEGLIENGLPSPVGTSGRSVRATKACRSARPPRRNGAA